MGKTRIKNEIVLDGRAVSRGIGQGRILCLQGRRRQFYETRLRSEDIEKEIRRFRASVRLAKRQLNKIRGGEDHPVGENQASIFETHLLFLEDKSLLSKIESAITADKMNAEWAVRMVADEYISRYKLLSDKHLREKYIDLEDIAERLLTALGGGKRRELSLDQNTIVAAREVNPTTLIELSQSNPRAIVTENGGWTSHTFILARELEIPAVTGIRGLLRRVETGDSAIVDGFAGSITLNPSAESVRQFDRRSGVSQEIKAGIPKSVKKGLRTLDGIEITIRANLDFAAGYEEAAKYGAKGIGLYRSEFLFNQNRGYPNEDEQVESYVRAAENVGKDGVRIRTFDLGVEQLADQQSAAEKNPALGLRAIRLSLTNKTEFRVQLRSLLRAAYKRRLDIILPMISDISEIRDAKTILAEEKLKLKNEGIKFGDPGLGAMIEVPAAVLSIDRIVGEVDFVCLGTNDLVQYLLAVDRDNEHVADWFRTLHPAVIKSIRLVLEAGRKSGKPVIICGEMAGSPIYAVILIGLGAVELSMNLHTIERVRRVIGSIALEEARSIVKKIERCSTSDEVEAEIRGAFSERWANLFDSSLLPQS